MHFPLPFMIYPGSKYPATIHIAPWNLPNLLKQCRNQQAALSGAGTGVSMLMHISSPGHPMAGAAHQGCLHGSGPSTSPKPQQDDDNAEYPAANTQPLEIPIWSCKAPNSCDSKAHLGSHNPPTSRNSSVSLLLLSTLKMTIL